MSKENGLLATFTKFMLEHDTECEDDIYQNEDIDRDSFELIEDLFNIVKSKDNSCNCKNNNSRDNKPVYRYDNRQTNADRIRQMSDEELASWYVIKCTIMMKRDCPKPYKTCKDCILEWLQQEAE